MNGALQEYKEIIFREDYDRMFNKLEAALKRFYLGEKDFDFDEYLRISYVLGGSFGVCMTLYHAGGVVDAASVYRTLAELLEHTMRGWRKS